MWIYLPDSIKEQQEVVSQVIQVDDQILERNQKYSLSKPSKISHAKLINRPGAGGCGKINKLLQEV